MIMKANKQIGFIYKDNESIDKILEDGDVVFERGFLREKTSTTLPITFGGVGKDLKDYKIYGNTYQNSTSGKNLIGFDDQQKTLYGITATFVDNVITLNGTLTQNYAVNYAKSKDINLQSNANKSYILSYKVISGTKNVKLGISFRDENGTQLDYIQDSNATDLSTYKNISSSTLNATKYFNFFVRTKEQLDNLIIELQLEEGSVATEFEPYTGGQPSPNPDYPQEMVSCGDRTKNLFDKNNANNLLNNVSINNGTSVISNANGFYTLRIDCKPNTTYTISKVVSSRFIVAYSNNLTYTSGETLLGKVSNNSATNLTITTGENAKTLYVFYSHLSDETTYTLQQILDSIQIEENSIATSYEPYGYKIPVNVRSENLFDIDTISNIGGGTNNNGIITSTTRSTSGTINLNFKFSDILVKAGETLYFSADIKLNNDSIGTFSTINDNVHAGATKIIYPTLNNKYQRYQTSYTYSNDETVKSMLIQIGNLLGSFEVSNIMISKDDSIIYKPYYNETTNIYLDEPLRKIDGYSDYIDFINGKVVRNIGNKVLDGSETYYGGGAGTGSPDYTYVYTKVFDSLAISGVCPIFSSHFATIKGNMARGTVVSIDTMCIDKSASTDRTRFLILTSRLSASTTSAFKTWLSSNNVTVDYALSTPTEEDIELPNIPTIDGNNTLNIETEITPSKVYIKYKSNN